jgi:hypothetical protein
MQNLLIARKLRSIGDARSCLCLLGIKFLVVDGTC